MIFCASAGNPKRWRNYAGVSAAVGKCRLACGDGQLAGEVGAVYKRVGSAARGMLKSKYKRIMNLMVLNGGCLLVFK